MSTPNPEREAFEKWASGIAGGNHYWMWQAWQARAQTSATSVPAPAPEPVFPPGVAEHEQWRMDSIIQAAWAHDPGRLALALMSMPATRIEIGETRLGLDDERAYCGRLMAEALRALLPTKEV